MDILGGTELHFSPETSDDLMLLARDFDHNSLIMHLVPQRNFPRRGENLHELWQELDRSPRGIPIEAEFQSIHDGFADVQRCLSMIQEKFDEKLEPMLLGLQKIPNWW
jgi:hypothetical protein